MQNFSLTIPENGKGSGLLQMWSLKVIFLPSRQYALISSNLTRPIPEKTRGSILVQRDLPERNMEAVHIGIPKLLACHSSLKQLIRKSGKICCCTVTSILRKVLPMLKNSGLKTEQLCTRWLQ